MRRSNAELKRANADLEKKYADKLEGCDRVPLAHVLHNSISNALKYQGNGRPRVEISAERHSEWWQFAVKDNGIGIPLEFHTQIFGIFKRLHDRNQYPGTGIGLAICQKAVEGYGGRIRVESGVGLGSTFFFTPPDGRDDGK